MSERRLETTADLMEQAERVKRLYHDALWPLWDIALLRRAALDIEIASIERQLQRLDEAAT